MMKMRQLLWAAIALGTGMLAQAQSPLPVATGGMTATEGAATPSAASPSPLAVSRLTEEAPPGRGPLRWI